MVWWGRKGGGGEEEKKDSCGWMGNGEWGRGKDEEMDNLPAPKEKCCGLGRVLSSGVSQRSGLKTEAEGPKWSVSVRCQ